MSSLGAPFVWCEDGERSQQPARRGELTSNRLWRAQRSTRLARLSALVSTRTSRLASILLHRILLSQSPRCSTHYWKGAVDVRLSADPAPPRLVVSSTRPNQPSPARYARSSLYSLEVPEDGNGIVCVDGVECSKGVCRGGRDTETRPHAPESRWG